VEEGGFVEDCRVNGVTEEVVVDVVVQWSLSDKIKLGAYRSAMFSIRTR
jgi:hypothetical protein